MEDYLKAIWSLSGESPAATNTIAGALRLSSPSVSAMLVRLDAAGLVDYERYKGARLTEEGRELVVGLMRRHRLVETFMIECLGYSWEEVHEEAEVIEHAITDRFTARLEEFLGRPTHDPHGDPIPAADGTFPDTPDTPLADLEAGETLEVARLLTQCADLLGYLDGLGLQPGRVVRVRAREPFGGLLHIEVGGTPQVVSRDLALLVRGRTR